MKDYNNIELEAYVNVSLIGTHNSVIVVNPIFKWSRRSIYEGIFESNLASKAGCSMLNGNTYKFGIDDNSLYVHCEGEYAYFGTEIANS